MMKINLTDHDQPIPLRFHDSYTPCSPVMSSAFIVSPIEIAAVIFCKSESLGTGDMSLYASVYRFAVELHRMFLGWGLTCSDLSLLVP